MTEVATDSIGVLVERLAASHASGGMVIERSVILAEGADSAAILSWITDHDGVADSTAASNPSRGLHGSRTDAASEAVTARRFVLPASAFLASPAEEDRSDSEARRRGLDGGSAGEER